MAYKWEKLHGTSDDAILAYTLVQPVIDSILRGQDINEFFPLPAYLTWRNILHGVCWTIVLNADREVVETLQRADSFYAEYGESAPYVAASMLVEFHVQNILEEDKLRASCFMKVYSDEQNSWYDYNDMLEESMLAQDGKAVPGCRCLPRHFKECRKPSQNTSQNT
jgi:hypothetical protein